MVIYKRVGMYVALLLLGVVGVGCQNHKEEAQANAAPPPGQAYQPPPSPPTPPPASETPLKDAIEAHFASIGLKGNHSAIPAGTRLVSVKLEEGVASLDVSKEFGALANRGETTESRAQKELRALLAQFPTVQKMRLTVEGKPFDSQATDWNTPFPVRDHDSADHSKATTSDGERDDR